VTMVRGGEPVPVEAGVVRGGMQGRAGPGSFSWTSSLGMAGQGAGWGGRGRLSLCCDMARRAACRVPCVCNPAGGGLSGGRPAAAAGGPAPGTVRVRESCRTPVGHPTPYSHMQTCRRMYSRTWAHATHVFVCLPRPGLSSRCAPLRRPATGSAARASRCTAGWRAAACGASARGCARTTGSRFASC
jgi:hypothetical protein